MEPVTAKKPTSSLPVDSDGKSTVFRPFSISPPHMRAFHVAWISLFSCFFTTFSIPPLIPIIREDLNLTETDIGTAGITAFISSIFSRICMGPLCELFGPRIVSASLSLITAPIVLMTSFVYSAEMFIVVRFLIGFCLANFVANQFWMSSMFSSNVVGLANGVASGWACMGAGVAQLVMPVLFSFLQPYLHASIAWRVIFIVPALFQAVTALTVLAYGQDLPSGNYKDKNNSGKTETEMQRENFLEVLFRGLKNYRGWILALLYGYCFGVELTTDNIIAAYFFDRFAVNIEIAGTIAACFGMTNFFSRPIGGMLSDAMGKRFGMRGRLWGLWMVQTIAGLFCVLLGRVNSLWGSICVMCAFSVCVQAASGLTFGVVPFVSKRSLGVIAGMTGSGGTVGAVMTQFLLFSGSTFTKQTSISLMGLMMIVCTLPITLIYFPRSGGIFCGPSIDAKPIENDHHYPLLQEQNDREENP